MTNQLILSRLSRSLERLFDLDGELFDRGEGGIHEQSLTFRLGLYLQDEFPNLHVDCEYNRRGDDLKKRRPGGSLMKPDVVVHRRTERDSNTLVVEAKKAIHWDREYRDLRNKLCGLTNSGGLYGYQIGLCWKVEASRTRADHSAFWFSNGSFLLETPLHRFQSAVHAKLQEFGYGW